MATDTKRTFIDWLGDRSFIFWFLAITLLCYFVWNPISQIPSLGGILGSDSVPLSMKVLTGALTGVILWLITLATVRAIGGFGITVFILLIALTMWVLGDAGLMDIQNPTVWQWAIQPLIASVLALGIYWPKLRYAATGTRHVDADEDFPDE